MRTCRLFVFWFLRWLVGYLALERSGVCGLVAGVEAKRVLSDGIPILDRLAAGLAPGPKIQGQPESLILAQNERWRHA